MFLTLNDGPTAAYFKDVVATKDTTRNIAEDGSLKGKFSGVDGTYKCAGGDCTIGISANNDKGITIGGDGTLTFEPTLAEGAELSSIFVEGTPKDDDEYLWFGYWMSGSDHDIYTDAGAGGEIGYGNNLDDLETGRTGVTAKYSGAAGGYYTHGDNAGEFAAKASLTADFGAAGKIADDNANMIGGTISDFEATSGDGDLDAWKLTLKATGFNDAGVIAGGITSSPDAEAGEWRADLHGQTAGGNASDDAPVMVPAAVTGQFTGNFGAGSHVAGAFAAEKE